MGTSADILLSAERMLTVVGKHLDCLDAKRAEELAEYEQTPSRNQGFILVSDDRGIARMDADAMLIVEHLFFDIPDGFLGDPVPPHAAISIEDLNASRQYSTSQFPLPPGVNNVRNEGAIFIPPIVFAPQGDIDPSEMNLDYYFNMPVEMLIPRAGVFKFSFIDPTTLGDPASVNFPPIRVSLLGYKVF